MITSSSNQKIKNVMQLVSSAKTRREEGKYVVEGQKMFLEAPHENLLEVYVSESFAEKVNESRDSDLKHVLDEIKAGSSGKYKNTDFEIVSDQVFKKMSDTVTPQGVLCVLKKTAKNLDSVLNEILGNSKASSKSEESSDGATDGTTLRILVLEGVQDPGNLGTMLRTSEAAGFNFILADRNTVDVYNPKVIRSTMGSIYRVPVIYTENLLADMDKLKEYGVTSYAAHLKGENSFRDIKYNEKCAILIGNEGKGLTDAISDKADVLVKIPMAGKVESLNAAVAAALMMFEAGR